MANLYTKKTWSNERIMDSDMNRMENALAGRAARFVVDPAGTSGDYYTIQNAIDAAEADGGGMIFVKRGDGTPYVLSTGLVIDNDNIELVSDGAIIRTTGAFPMITIGPGAGTKENARVAGFRFEQLYANMIMDIQRMYNVRIERNYFDFTSFTAAMAAIRVRYGSDELMILNNFFDQGSNYGMYIDTWERMLIAGNMFEEGKGTPILVKSSLYALIKNNIIKNPSSQANATYYGIVLQDSDHCIVGNNEILSLAANKPQSSIDENGTSNYNLIHDNMIRSWAGSSITTVGAQTLTPDNLTRV